MEPSDAAPFVVAIVGAVGGLALASHGPATYRIGLAIFLLATCYGYWSEKRYVDRRERRHVGGTMPNQAVALRMSRTELLQVYGEAGQYDRHYSTVRATVCVFLLTAAVALSAYIMQTSSRPAGQETSGHVAAAPPPDWISWVIVGLVLLLLILANVVNLYFQRCSFACRQLQRRAEELLADNPVPECPADNPVAQALVFVGFRTGFRDEYERAAFSLAEPISKYLVVGSALYLIGLLVAVHFKLSL